MPGMLETVIDFANAHVAVLGDVMLDRFVFGEVGRISPEAPVPVLRVARQVSMLGGAGNLACNIARLGGRVTLIGVIGDDAAGEEIVAAAARERGMTTALVREPAWNTIVKTRFVAQAQQLLRVDDESPCDVEHGTAERLLSALNSALRDVSLLVCSDYDKGTMTETVLARAIRHARARGCSTIVDPKLRDFRRYAGATLITPNAHEASLATGIACDSDEGVVQAARAIADVVDCRAVIVTRGARGMTILSRAERGEDVLHLPTEAKEVRDVSGAGDTVVAVLALALAADLPLDHAARLANIAAGIAVGKVGTSPVESAELARAIRISQVVEQSTKIVGIDAAASIASTWRMQGLRVVFTNGCFDLLHPGHIRLLEKAKSQGDRLIVALNSDGSVKRLKGAHRPIQTETARAVIMSSISVVDLVTTFADDTPLASIEAIQPDVLVKGADYTEEQVVGAEFVKARGGRVVLVELEEGHSTSNTVRRASNVKS